LDLPLEVDDEYWETADPELAFKQPEGVPSRIAALNTWTRITQILAFALRTLYVLDPKKIFLGRQTLPDSECIVQQLDMTLTEWANSVPEHLRWANQSGDPIFSNQSATLHLSYHLTHILIYRIFIPFSQILPPGLRGLQEALISSKSSSLTGRALSICVNAAKACARIIEEQMGHGFSEVSLLISACNVCAAILIVHLWDLKAKEMAEGSFTEDIKPVHTLAHESVKKDLDIFMNALEWAELRYPIVTEILTRLRASFPSAYDFDRPSKTLHDPSLPMFEDSLWQWESSTVPSEFPSLSWLNRGQSDKTTRHLPLRTDVHVVPSQSRAPYRRDSDSMLRQSTASLLTPQPSPLQVPTNISNHFMPERESFRSISSVPGTPFISPSPTDPGFTTTGSSCSNHPSFYNPYQIHGGSYAYLPTSDARSIPTPSVRRGYSSDSTWNDYRPL
jgi:hypothetical protein